MQWGDESPEVSDERAMIAGGFLAISIVAAVGVLLAFCLKGLKPRHAYS